MYNNRLDTTLADVFNLLSLFYLTIGKTRECPATYSQIASMRVSPSPVLPTPSTRRGRAIAGLPSLSRHPAISESQIGPSCLKDARCLLQEDGEPSVHAKLPLRPIAAGGGFSFAAHTGGIVPRGAILRCGCARSTSASARPHCTPRFQVGLRTRHRKACLGRCLMGRLPVQARIAPS